MTGPEAPASGPVLFCFGGSEGAHRALAEAARLLVPRQSITLTVWQPVAVRFAAGEAFAGTEVPYLDNERDLDNEEESAARQAAEHGATTVREHGWHATIRVAAATTAIWRTVIDVADDADAALIVCGARGLNAIKRTILGSVSDAVLHHTRRPALIAHQPPP